MDSNPIRSERLRLKAEYERRELEVERDLYAPWQPGEMLMLSERKRVAATMLKERNRFPKTGERCLEIGYGKLGWLADLISWGIRERDLYGIELDGKRASHAQGALPEAHLEVGDATKLPWENSYFDFVVVSTVFSSVLDRDVRKVIADEINRVLSSQGVVIVYDVCVNNPRNKSLFRLKRRDVATMFPDLKCAFRSVTLAPPIARFAAKRSWALALMLGCIPLLRTHFIATLAKQ
jgi:hypothetical protein